MVTISSCLVGICVYLLLGAPLYLMLESVTISDILQRSNHDVDEFINAMDVLYGGKGEFYRIHKRDIDDRVLYVIRKVGRCFGWFITSWIWLNKVEKAKAYLDKINKSDY